MANDFNKELGFSVAALYKVGNYTDAALVGAIMFERAIYYLLSLKSITKEVISSESRSKEKGELEYAISRVCQEYEEYESTQLHNIRINVRNKIIHENEINEINEENILPMVKFVWKVFDIDSYTVAENGDVSKIDILSADYSVVAMREILNKNIQDLLASEHEFSGFLNKEFENLLVLRKKMIALGSKIKNEILKVHYKNELYIDLISKVDTTSAYVWMPMSLHKEEGTKLNVASVSLLATPLDFRIYLDIGGGAYQVRKDYYEFLTSEYFQNFWKQEGIEETQLFDNDWYCFIVNKKELLPLTSEEISKFAESAKAKLEEYDETSIITWNRMLCGYIIERGEIPFVEIREKLNTIIKLYYCFEQYRKEILETSTITFKYDINNICKNKKHQNPVFDEAILKTIKKKR